MKKAFILALLLFASICLVSCAKAEPTESDSIQPTPTQDEEPVESDRMKPPLTNTDSQQELVRMLDRAGWNGRLNGILEWAEKENGITQSGQYFFDENDEFKKYISEYRAVVLSDESVIGYVVFTEEQDVEYIEGRGHVAGPGIDYITELVSREADKLGKLHCVDKRRKTALFIIADGSESDDPYDFDNPYDRLRIYNMNIIEGRYWDER